MMVNEKVGAIYLGHTRTGCRNTYRELEHHGFRLVGRRHWNPADLRQMAGVWNESTPIRNLDWWEEIGGWERKWKFFCTIRDPYAYLLSHYCWNPHSGTKEITEPISVEWLQRLRKTFPAYFPLEGKLWRFLYNPGCFRVMRLEHLEAHLSGILRLLGLPGELKFLGTEKADILETKTWNKPEGDPRSWFTPEALAWFREHYAEELKATSYE